MSMSSFEQDAYDLNVSLVYRGPAAPNGTRVGSNIGEMFLQVNGGAATLWAKTGQPGAAAGWVQVSGGGGGGTFTLAGAADVAAEAYFPWAADQVLLVVSLDPDTQKPTFANVPFGETIAANVNALAPGIAQNAVNSMRPVLQWIAPPDGQPGSPTAAEALSNLINEMIMQGWMQPQA